MFAYRKTTFPSKDGIVIEAELDLEKGKISDIHQEMDKYLSRRGSTQPLTMPNSGSIFKNPDGEKAGRLIESAGLKGCRIGGASVSIKHANFIVNKGSATSSNIEKLGEKIKRQVLEKFGIELIWEIQIIGNKFCNQKYDPLINQNTGFNLSILKAKTGQINDLIFDKPTIIFSQKGLWKITINNDEFEISSKDTFSVPLNTKLNISIEDNEECYLNCVSQA